MAHSEQQWTRYAVAAPAARLLIGAGGDHPLSYYETLGGGEGGTPGRPGMSGIHTGMTNTRNTPAEAMELDYPLRVWRYELRSRSGGAGCIPVGDGLVAGVGAARHSDLRFTPMLSDHVVVASTTGSENAARALAAGVVEARLGACAQIVGPITSVYRWEGAVQTEQEWRVEIKTATDQVAALTEHIKANHSYDVPEIVVTPITGGSTEYLSWLVEETRS